MHDMILMARRNMDQDNWDYVCGAAESETSLRRNRMALDSLAFRPRVCRDVSEIDLSTDFFGHELRMPVLMAPMGSLHRFSPKGSLDVDDASEEFGTVNFLSTVTEPGLEEVAENTPHPKSFQIYVRGDNNWIKDLAKRIVKANYHSVTLTVDSAFYGNRERLTPHLHYVVSQREIGKKDHLDTVKMVQDAISTGFYYKGIMTAEDASLAVELAYTRFTYQIMEAGSLIMCSETFKHCPKLLPL